MDAAVVTSFDTPPQCGTFPTPVPVGEHEVLVDVVAAALHPRVRSQADGSHYTSTGVLPLVPGVDGVGRFPDGTLRYFVVPDTATGSMAEQTVVDARHSVVLPEGSDAVALAAAMNPAMSAWIALRRRTRFEAGGRVLVLGATGSAGRFAVQIARTFGAAEVIAAGRDPGRLAGLAGVGATATVSLQGDPAGVARRLGTAAADVDVVLDYVWGEPTAAALTAVATHRADPGKPLTWIEIGAVAGPAAGIPSAALRATRLSIVGSGQGSVGTAEIIAELPALAAAVTDGTLTTLAEPRPLAEVTTAWRDAVTSTARLVLVPGR